MNTHVPVVVIGAGPVGLAAAAHLEERGLPTEVLESGDAIGAAVRRWGHTRLFSPWRYNIDEAARSLLVSTGWSEPDPETLPTGHQLVDDYLEPLAAALRTPVRTGTRVIAITRQHLDKTRTHGREAAPFLIRVERTDGSTDDLLARAVLDASGTWNQPNPLGRSGLPAHGEDEVRARGLITAPLPSVFGSDRGNLAGTHVLVVGGGHSAANTLSDLAQLAHEEPRTRISWAIRASDPSRVFGGEADDELPARGTLGTRLRELVESGSITVHPSFNITALRTTTQGIDVTADTPEGTTSLTVDRIVPATGFRPDLSMLAELRLALDSAVDAPRQLGPLIDAEFHSCGTVEPHGARILAHPEPDFYIVGMKSYGRAPTFLMATGYEQVRSIAAALAGDHDAAEQVHLNLPSTGVCSADFTGSTVAEPTAAECCV